MEVTLLSFVAAKKRKDQHDSNLAGMGLNPAYAGAYGAAPAVSFFCFCSCHFGRGSTIIGHVKDLLICLHFSF